MRITNPESPEREAQVDTHVPISQVELPESFRDILERIADPLFALDTNWRFTYANDAAARLFGTTVEELIDRRIWTQFPDTVDGEAYHHYHHALETGMRTEFEIYCAAQQIHLRARIHPSADGLTICLTDITAERQARLEYDARLAEKEERYHMVADFTNDLEYWRGPGGELRYISPSCERITGYQAAEFMADPTLLERIVHPDDLRNVKYHFKKEMITEENYSLDFRIVRRDGEMRWINHVCQPVYDEEGKNRGRRGGNRDITNRKTAEAELERERALMTAVLDQLPVGVIIAESPSGRIIRGNAHMERICRHAIHSSEEPAEQCNCRLFHADGKPYKPEELPLARVLAGGGIVIDEEIHIQDGDGKPRVILMSAAPVCDQHGKAISVVVVSHDITAIKELDNAKDEFLAILSHELKTPLTSILGWSEFALDQSSADILDQAMAIIHRNARRQQRLIDELLDMSRLQHNRMDCVMETADLGRLTCQAVERAMEAADKAGIALALKPFGETLPILADPRRISFCIDHLLNNAIKFNSPGGKVFIACRRERKTAILTFRDTGRGIAPEVLPTVFIPFLQLDRDEAVGGLGLGLAIVRGIVDIHHGRVTAASPGLGQGCTFTIELPLMPPKESKV